MFFRTVFVAACSSATITLMPSAPTFGAPLFFRRSRDFSIVSLISFNCNSSVSMSMQWMIKNCTLSCSYLVRPGPTVVTTASELYIPARTLAYGLFELQITVNVSRWLLVSSVYVEITPSNITANLVRYGTSMIVCGDKQDLQLDPGSYSVDPDQDTFNASVGSPISSELSSSPPVV